MQKLHTVLIAFAAFLSLTGLAAAQDAPLQISGAKTVNARQIFELVAKIPDLVILDNRKQEDFVEGHIEGAIRLIDTDVDAESLAKSIKGKGVPVLFYCNGVKCGRAAKAVEKAVKLGYSKAYYYALGMDEWKAEGLPLVH